MAETIRIGKVSSIDYAKGLVSVTYPDQDGSVTRPLPILEKYSLAVVARKQEIYF